MEDIVVITSQIVAEKLRTDLLYTTFGPCSYLVENLSYNIADKLISGYNGGDWDYAKLSNGGMFAFLGGDRFLLQSMNGSNFEVTGEAAGLVIWLFTMSWGSDMFEGHQDLQSALVGNYDLLREYVYEHKEAREIFALCD